ncbi:MAG: YigZ family protein [Burkholderiales bacterium]|nr:YigZ family protein [Anaerolineae bacterium]
MSNSRFITTVNCVASVTAARDFLAAIRAELPDANHHVYAYRVGYGNSVIEGMSDDGEPSGTAGPPVLAVLRGTDIGDVIVVVTRYFGGTKLGTGGLVRAYSEAARLGLSSLKTEEKIEKKLLGIETPYSYYEQLKRLIVQHNGTIDDETFAADITILATFPVDDIAEFSHELAELTAGRVQPVELDD